MNIDPLRYTDISIFNPSIDRIDNSINHYLMDKDLQKDNFSLSNVSNYQLNIDASIEYKLVNKLKTSNEELKKDFAKAKMHQGWIGTSWDFIKTNIGTSEKNKDGTERTWYDPRKIWSNIFSYDNCSDNINQKIEENDKAINKLDSLARSRNKEEFNKQYENLTSHKASQEEIEASINILKDSKMAQNINNYKESQKNGVDVAADIVSGLVSFGAYTLTAGALVAAPFTGGSSLIVIPSALGIATAGGALVKVGLKSSDALTGSREYESLKYDIITGGLDGVLAPISAGVGSAAGKEIGKRMGVTIIRQGLELGEEETSKSGVLSALTTFTNKYSGGNIISRSTSGLVELSSAGSFAGSIDNTARHIYNNGIKGSAESFIQGAIGGAILSPLFGVGLKGIGKTGSKFGNMKNNKITTNTVLPEVNRHTNIPNTSDYDLLSVLNGYMKNPETAKIISESIETTLDGNYKVTINGKEVIVDKSVLDDSELYNKGLNAKIIEAAYKSTTGLNPGISEQLRKDLGLSPVIIEQSTNQVSKNNEVLSAVKTGKDNENIIDKAAKDYTITSNSNITPVKIINGERQFIEVDTDTNVALIIEACRDGDFVRIENNDIVQMPRVQASSYIKNRKIELKINEILKAISDKEKDIERKIKEITKLENDLHIDNINLPKDINEESLLINIQDSYKRYQKLLRLGDASSETAKLNFEQEFGIPIEKANKMIDYLKLKIFLPKSEQELNNFKESLEFYKRAQKDNHLFSSLNKISESIVDNEGNIEFRSVEANKISSRIVLPKNLVQAFTEIIDEFADILPTNLNKLNHIKHRLLERCIDNNSSSDYKIVHNLNEIETLLTTVRRLIKSKDRLLFSGQLNSDGLFGIHIGNLESTRGNFSLMIKDQDNTYNHFVLDKEGKIVTVIMNLKKSKLTKSFVPFILRDIK